MFVEYWNTEWHVICRYPKPSPTCFYVCLLVVSCWSIKRDFFILTTTKRDNDNGYRSTECTTLTLCNEYNNNNNNLDSSSLFCWMTADDKCNGLYICAHLCVYGSIRQFINILWTKSWPHYSVLLPIFFKLTPIIIIIIIIFDG